MIDLTEINISPEHRLIVRCDLPETNTIVSLGFDMSNIKEEIGTRGLGELFASSEMEEAIRTFLGYRLEWLAQGHVRSVTFDVLLVGASSINKNCLEAGAADACWPGGSFMICGIDSPKMEEELDMQEENKQ